MSTADDEQSANWCYTHHRMRDDEERDEQQAQEHPDDEQ